MRRRAQSDDRRRRILVDEGSRDLPGKKAVQQDVAEGSSYEADTLSRQPQCVHFLPRRLWVHPLLWLFTFMGMAGLIGLHRWQMERADGPWELFELQHPASLATWMAAVGLLMITVLALNIFSLRRHRKSDYHTRYRWWVWVSATAVLSSLAVTTSWHRVAARALDAATEWDLPWGDQLFWLVPTGVLYTFLAIRLLLEFRGCRIAILALAAAWGLFCLRGGMHLGYPFPGSWQSGIEGGALIGMVALLCCGFLWYARYVLLDVEGRLPLRITRVKRAAKLSNRSSLERQGEASSRPRGPSDLEPDTSRRVAELIEESGFEEDSEDEIATPPRKRAAGQRRAAEQDVNEREEMPEHRTHERQRKLSKAQRKKLRKQKAKERHAA